jgi:hypothetical protein
LISFLDLEFLSIKSMKCIGVIFALKNSDKNEDDKNCFKTLLKSYPILLEKMKNHFGTEFDLINKQTLNSKANGDSFHNFDLKIQVCSI